MRWEFHCPLSMFAEHILHTKNALQFPANLVKVQNESSEESTCWTDLKCSLALCGRYSSM
jgi:hypothetical protein